VQAYIENQKGPENLGKEEEAAANSTEIPRIYVQGGEGGEVLKHHVYMSKEVKEGERKGKE